MRPPTARAFILIGLFWVLATPVAAAGLPDWAAALAPDAALAAFPKAKAVVVLYHEECRIQEDGTSRVLVRKIFAVRDGDGGGETVLRFTASSQTKLKELSAWKMGPDGKVERYDKPIISQFHGGALYVEDKEYALAVPAVGPGTLFGKELSYESKRPRFGTDASLVRLDLPVYRWEYVLTLDDGSSAEGFWLDPVADRLEPAIPASAVEGTTTWTRDSIADLGDPEPLQPLEVWMAPRFIVRWSRGAGAGPYQWSDVAAWYRPLSESALDGSESLARSTSLRAIESPAGVEPSSGADSLAEDESPAMSESARLALCRSVARLVQSEVGYVQIYLDDGGLRPHKAADVYRNRYGDCKDISHLTVALLRGFGIRSYPVLTDTGRDPAIRPGFPTTSFDHCIVATEDPARPGGYLYFDPTAKQVPFGRLPRFLQGAPALIIRPGDANELVHLPIEDPARNGGSFHASVSLGSDLSVRAQIEEIRFGQPAFELRAWLADQTAAERKKWLNDRHGARSSRSVVSGEEFGDLTTPSDTLRIVYSLEIPGSARRIANRILWNPDIFPRKEQRTFPEDDRRRPVQFDYPSRWERTVEAVLPTEWTAEELPPPLSVDNEIGRFESRVTMDGNRLHFGWLESIESTFIPVEKYGLVREWDQAGFDSDRKGVLFSVR